MSPFFSHERVTDSYLKFIRSFLLHIIPIFKKDVGTLELFGCYPLKDGQKPPILNKDSFLERMCELYHWPGLHSELLSFESLKGKTFCSLLVNRKKRRCVPGHLRQ